jgi:excisionase family DNA binding protein
MTPETLETAAELARRWKLDPSTIYRLAMRQKDPLPSVKIGGRRRFVPSRVEAWLESQGDGGVMSVELVDVEC